MMTWAQYGSNLATIIGFLAFVWLVASMIIEAAMSRAHAARVSEAENRCRQLEWENWELRQIRVNLNWARTDLEWERSRRIAAEKLVVERTEDLYRLLGSKADTDENSGGAAQIAA